jgi:hypothetical protein
MQSLSDWLQPAGQLIWGDLLTHCPGLVVPGPLCQKVKKYWRQQIVGARQDSTYFRQISEVNISAQMRPIKKW